MMFPQRISNFIREKSTIQRLVQLLLLLLIIFTIRLLVLRIQLHKQQNSQQLDRVEEDVLEVDRTRFPYMGSCTPAPQTCQPNNLNVPNIVHLIWFHKRPAIFRFHNYISALSAVKIQQPQEVYLWHDTIPEGLYWPNLIKEISKRDIKLRFKNVQPPKTIFGTKVLIPEHAADIQRLLVLLEFGGIYMDLDVIILKPLTSLMCYNVTLGQETEDKLNNGLILAKPSAEFLKLWYQSYRTFDPYIWDSHNVKMPYLLYLKNPSLIHLETDCLQHPSWTRLERPYLFAENIFCNWSSNLAVHTWYRFNSALEMNSDSIKLVNTTVAQIFYFIYYGIYRKDTTLPSDV